MQTVFVDSIIKVAVIKLNNYKNIAFSIKCTADICPLSFNFGVHFDKDSNTTNRIDYA